MGTKKGPRKRRDVITWLRKTGRSQAGWSRELGLRSPMTVWHWLNLGVVPHDIYLDRIKERTPGCPLIKA